MLLVIFLFGTEQHSSLSDELKTGEPRLYVHLNTWFVVATENQNNAPLNKMPNVNAHESLVDKMSGFQLCIILFPKLFLECPFWL